MGLGTCRWGDQVPDRRAPRCADVHQGADDGVLQLRLLLDERDQAVAHRVAVDARLPLRWPHVTLQRVERVEQHHDRAAHPLRILGAKLRLAGEVPGGLPEHLLDSIEVPWDTLQALTRGIGPGQFGVMSIPTFVVFKDGQPAKSIVGARSKEDMQQMIDSVIA
jgi:hypothetical protein